MNVHINEQADKENDASYKDGHSGAVRDFDRFHNFLILFDDVKVRTVLVFPNLFDIILIYFVFLLFVK